MAPLALRVDIRDVAPPRMVLLVHGEVHHKVHLVREVESEAVALLIGGGWSSKLDAGLLVNGHLIKAAGRSVHAVEHLGCGDDDSEEVKEECVEVDDDNDEEEDFSPPSCSST